MKLLTKKLDISHPFVKAWVKKKKKEGKWFRSECSYIHPSRDITVYKSLPASQPIPPLDWIGGDFSVCLDQESATELPILMDENTLRFCGTEIHQIEPQEREAETSRHEWVFDLIACDPIADRWGNGIEVSNFDNWKNGEWLDDDFRGFELEAQKESRNHHKPVLFAGGGCLLGYRLLEEEQEGEHLKGFASKNPEQVDRVVFSFDGDEVAFYTYQEN